MGKIKKLKKIVKEELLEEDVPFEELPLEDELTIEENSPSVPEGIDFMEMLNSPIAKALLEGGKDLFKKEKVDPNICEINIKAPSEVVLKLFNIKE